MSVTIYHNPRCSKSRETLALLQERGVEPVIVQYLETPPDVDTLRDIARKLGVHPRELLRTNEDAYRELALEDLSKSEEEILAAMSEHPVLIQRPIVLANGEARIGRPPEAVLAILD